MLFQCSQKHENLNTSYPGETSSSKNLLLVFNPSFTKKLRVQRAKYFCQAQSNSVHGFSSIGFD